MPPAGKRRILLILGTVLAFIEFCIIPGALIGLSLTMAGEDSGPDGQVVRSGGEAAPSNQNNHPNSAASQIDSDGDGLSDQFESSRFYTYKTDAGYMDPYDADMDDDGLSDGDELLALERYRNGEHREGDLVQDAAAYWGKPISLKPWDPDTDRDGLPDGTEVGVTSPIPDGPVINVPGEGEVQIKGTDVDAKFYFGFSYREMGKESPPGVDDEKLFYQERFCFRADENPGYGQGHYFTDPVINDTNTNDVFDGLDDFPQDALEEGLNLEDPAVYNAPNCYDGDYDEGEGDAMTGLYPVSEDNPYYTMILSDGFFLMTPRTLDPNDSEHGNSIVKVYFLIGPSIAGNDIEWRIINDPYRTVTPKWLRDTKVGKRYLLTFENFNYQTTHYEIQYWIHPPTSTKKQDKADPSPTPAPGDSGMED